MRSLLLGLAACWGQNAYIVEGTVVEVSSPTEIVLDHGNVPGLMGPMVMPFVLDAAITPPLRPGDRVVGRMAIEDGRAHLVKVRVTGFTAPAEPDPSDVVPVRPGQLFPRTEIPAADGSTWVVGSGQPGPTVLTFLYTTCPLPAFCPLTVAHLQALQPKLPAGARQIAVTVDPERDTLELLAAYGTNVGVQPDRWGLGRLEPAALADLARRSGLSVVRENDGIVHALRWLVLDAEGRLIERYDDNAFPMDRVLQQLTTGGPPAPTGSDGTLTLPEATP